MTFTDPEWVDRIPLRPRGPGCVGPNSHRTKACACYSKTRQQAFRAEHAPRALGPLLCMIGWHRWANDPQHWRRWCLECGHGNEPAPDRPAA